jgi:hypothetical protein
MSQTTVQLIQDGSIITADLSTSIISTDRLVDGSVNTAKIADASVTKAKLAADIKLQAYPFTTSGFSIPI